LGDDGDFFPAGGDALVEDVGFLGDEGDEMQRAAGAG
jgi:hypothetical protein